MASRNADEAAQVAAQRAQAQLAGKIVKVARQARANRVAGFRIPELDEDPAPDDPTNAWILADGRLRVRTLDGIVHEFGDVVSGGGTPGSSTSTKPKPSNPTPKRHTKTYSATWARIYCATHGVETGARLNYGTFPGSSHGMRRIMIGFNDSAIRSDLSGSTIRSVELTMLNTHAWSNGGITVHFGAHNRSTPPGGFSAVRRNAWRGDWPKSGRGKTWRGIPDGFGRLLRDGTIRGLTIEQPSTSAAYYGEMDWSTVAVRIGYTK